MPFRPPREEKSVAVVIVNWNGWRECIECLNSLLSQDYRNFHVFIVDNDSSDDSIDHIVAWCRAPGADPRWRGFEGVARLTDQPCAAPVTCRVIDQAQAGLPHAPIGCNLTLIRAGCNFGFAAGCNVGIKAADPSNFDYFWFLNADTVVNGRALMELVKRAEQHPNTGMVGSTIRYYDAPETCQAMGGARLNRSNGLSKHIGQGAPVSDVPADGSEVERELAHVMGASMLVSSAFIRDVGLMEEDYFLYYEEIDWALRGAPRFTIGYASRSHVFHKWGVNSHKATPLLSQQYFYRNRLRFVARFLPDRLAAAKRSLFEQMLRHIARGRWGEARVIFATLLSADKITAGLKPKGCQ